MRSGRGVAAPSRGESMSSRKMRRCPLCGRNRVLLSINEAAEFVHVSRKTIYRWLNMTMLDHCLLPSGALRIFKDSLIALPQVRKRAIGDDGTGTPPDQRAGL